MSNIVACEYHSQWDDGRHTISTLARVNLDTGALLDIEVSDEDVEVLDILDRVYITLDGVAEEFAVTTEGEAFPDGRVEDLPALKDAYEAARAVNSGMRI